jgi:hypothetical protein
MDHLWLISPIFAEIFGMIAAIAYIVVTAPLLFYVYAAIGRRNIVHGRLWPFAKVVVSVVALSILWVPILHVGVPGREQPFSYVLSAFYAVIMGVIYVAADRYIQQA